MALELAIRIRCDACGMAIERIAVAPVTELPVKANFNTGSLPDGWLIQDGAVFCVDHHPSLVQAATMMPAADTLREIVRGGR